MILWITREISSILIRFGRFGKKEAKGSLCFEDKLKLHENLGRRDCPTQAGLTWQRIALLGFCIRRVDTQHTVACKAREAIWLHRGWPGPYLPLLSNTLREILEISVGNENFLSFLLLSKWYVESLPYKDITGYQRDFLKLRADHATSLHCDMIYYYNYYKHSSHKILSQIELWRLKGCFAEKG